MFLDLPLYADILTLQKHCQQLVDNCLLHANAQRIPHDYKVGDHVLKKAVLSLSNKLWPSFSGPFPIIAVHTNGTVTVRLADNTTEHLNIRHVKPYHDPR